MKRAGEAVPASLGRDAAIGRAVRRSWRRTALRERHTTRQPTGLALPLLGAESEWMEHGSAADVEPRCWGWCLLWRDWDPRTRLICAKSPPPRGSLMHASCSYREAWPLDSGPGCISCCALWLQERWQIDVNVQNM